MKEISIQERIAFAGVLFFVLLGVYYSHTDLEYFNSVYTLEDNVIEWGTVFALLLGAFISFYRSYILKPFRGWKFQVCLILLGLLFIFGAGEEISWGQRIFNISTPEFFMQHNAQHETNLHNLVVGGTKINKLVFGLILGICVAFYLLILPVLYRKYEKIKKLIDDFAIPIPRGFHIIAYLVLVALVETIPGPKKGEIIEFGGCWVFTLMTFNPFNRELFSRKSFER